MTKIQKVWLAVSISLFAIPELLWSPVGNYLSAFFVYSNQGVFLRNNFFTQSDNKIYLLVILAIQFFSACSAIFLTIKISNKIFFAWILLVALILVAISSFFAWYLVFAAKNIGF